MQGGGNKQYPRDTPGTIMQGKNRFFIDTNILLIKSNVNKQNKNSKNYFVNYKIEIIGYFI